MPTSRCRLAVLVLVAFTFTGCPENSGGPDLRIVRPAGGVSSTSTEFEIEASGQVDPSSVRIELNGTLVPAASIQVQPHSAGATIRGEMDREVLQPTRFNTLEITARTTSGQAVEATSNFVWFDGVAPAGGASTLLAAAETVAGGGSAGGASGGSAPGGLSGLLSGILPTAIPGPQLVVHRPTTGEFVPLGQAFEIEGTATDPLGVAELTLATDGQPPTSEISYLDPVSGRFLLECRFDEPGLHRFLVVATNTLGGKSYAKVSVYVGERRPTGAEIELSSQLALTSKGFHSLGKLIEPILTPDVMYRDVPRNTQIWSERIGPAKAKMWALGIGHRRLILDLSVEQGLLHIHADLEQLHLSKRIETKALFVKTTAYSTTQVDHAVYDAWATMTKGPGGDVLMTVQRQDVVLNGMNTSVKGLPKMVVGPVVDFAQSYLHAQIRTVLQEYVGRLIAQRLTGFFRVPVQRRVQILDAELLAGGEMSVVELRDDHGRFWTTSSVIAAEADNPVQPPHPGWLHTPNARFDVPLENELTVAISDDILNQTLYEAFRAGATNLDLEELLSRDELRTLTIGVLESFLGTDVSRLLGLADDVPVSVEVTPMLAPVLILGYRGHDVVVQAHEVVVDIYVELESTRSLLFSLIADIDLPLEDLQVDIQANSIKAQPKDLLVGAQTTILPYIDFRLEEMPLVELSFEVFRPLIVTVAELAMPFLLEVLADPDFAELADLPLVDIRLSGRDDHLFLSGRLDATGRARDNGGPPDYGEGSKEEEKGKLAFKFCALVALFGGTRHEGLLDTYREFRDRHLGGRDSGASDAYYRYGFLVPLAAFLHPELETPLTVAFVAGALVIGLLLRPELLLALVLALALAPRLARAARARCRGRRCPILRAFAS